MSSNLFQRISRMLPDAVVYVGRVLAHHDDDTSTVELPIGLTTTAVGGGLARGSLIRPRGRTVPVGGWAFVRRGVIETHAPTPAPEAIAVGAPVTPPVEFEFLETFGGTIGDDLGSRPADTGEEYLEGGPFTGWELAGGSAVRGSSSAGATFDFAPPDGSAFYLEATISNLTARFTMSLISGEDPESDHSLSVTARNRSTDLLRVDVELRDTPDTDETCGFDVTALSALAEHVIRMEVSADRLTWGVLIDGTHVADSPMTAGAPMAVTRARFGFGSDLLFDYDVTVSRVEGGLI